MSPQKTNFFTKNKQTKRRERKQEWDSDCNLEKEKNRTKKQRCKPRTTKTLKILKTKIKKQVFVDIVTWIEYIDDNIC